MTLTANPERTQHHDEITLVTCSSCPICGARGETLYRELHDWQYGIQGNWSLSHCECGVAWLNPRPADEDIPLLYSRYYTHRVAAAAGRIQQMRHEISKCELARLGYKVEPSRELLPRLLSHLRSFARGRSLEVLALPSSEEGSLLDVGCGNGDFLRRMHSLGWRVSGVEPDRTAVAYAASQGFQVFNGTIRDVPTNAQYDVITLNHVIEHVSDPVELLRQCGKRLRQNTGQIVLTTPNFKSLGSRWFGRHWRGLEVPRHLNIFSVESLRACVARAGLRVDFISTEARMARMIHNTSSYARRGERSVTEQTPFDTRTKIAGYLFRTLEGTLIRFNKGLGEELFCVVKL
jgi:2-polyprenyl-3-methyl-5-hydroxy-6-metoxy-1,4-benzoquinol methylase